jgi:hypothetical protein
VTNDQAGPTGVTGGCQCGAVRYSLDVVPSHTQVCHCRMCQKAVGGPFAALAPVRLADFAWTRGTPALFESSSVAYRHYCRACGTPLTFGYRHKPWIDVTIGSLDEPERVPPVRQYGIESRLSWYEPAAIERLPTQATEVTIEGRPLPVESYQHPDHETHTDWQPRRG